VTIGDGDWVVLERGVNLASPVEARQFREVRFPQARLVSDPDHKRA
jgi:hypothetical protein